MWIKFYTKRRTIASFLALRSWRRCDGKEEIGLDREETARDLTSNACSSMAHFDALGREKGADFRLFLFSFPYPVYACSRRSAMCTELYSLRVHASQDLRPRVHRTHRKVTAWCSSHAALARGWINRFIRRSRIHSRLADKVSHPPEHFGRWCDLRTL